MGKKRYDDYQESIVVRKKLWIRSLLVNRQVSIISPIFYFRFDKWLQMVFQ